MIAKLRGIIDNIGENSIIIDVGGVGYLVFCSAKTIAMMPQKGGNVSLFIETHVREDHIHLYGFATMEEKKWFLLLTKVQGVGAKVALSILSIMTPDKVAEAIISSDKTAISKADGVGAKIALRIITELKDKQEIQNTVISIPQNLTPAKTGLLEDAVSALINLGYQRADAYSKVSKIIANTQEEKSVSDLIKQALKEFAKKG